MKKLAFIALITALVFSSHSFAEDRSPKTRKANPERHAHVDKHRHERRDWHRDRRQERRYDRRQHRRDQRYDRHLDRRHTTRHVKRLRRQHRRHHYRDHFVGGLVLGSLAYGLAHNNYGVRYGYWQDANGYCYRVEDRPRGPVYVEVAPNLCY